MELSKFDVTSSLARQIETLEKKAIDGKATTRERTLLQSIEKTMLESPEKKA